MAVFRDNPYGNFNFLVALGGEQGDGSQGTVIGGFSEVSGLGASVDYVEYRNGNERFNSTRKIPGLTKYPDLVLKRGVIGSADLFHWLKGVSGGTAEPRDVRITLLDEARNPVMTWWLRNAQPKAWSGPSLAAKSGAVAVEELVLVYEGLELD